MARGELSAPGISTLYYGRVRVAGARYCERLGGDFGSAARDVWFEEGFFFFASTIKFLGVFFSYDPDIWITK